MPPPPTTPPPSPTLRLASPWSTGSRSPATPPQLAGTTILGTFVTITEVETNSAGAVIATMPSFVLPSDDINIDGSFSFAFQDFTDSDGNPLNNGYFEVYATATYSVDHNKVGPSTRSNTFAGTLTGGSATVTGVSSTAGLATGDVVTGTGISSGTTILSVNSLTSTVTLSTNATTTGSENLLATVFFDIDNTKPGKVTNLHLNPADDTGIVGDNVTTPDAPIHRDGPGRRHHRAVRLQPSRHPEHRGRLRLGHE